MTHEILNRKTIHNGRIFDVQIIETRLPNGKTTQYDIVSHPGAVAIIPVDEDGNIWFVSQYRAAVGRSMLELPAGLLEPGEEPDRTAEREIREEIGQAPERLEKLGQIFLTPGYSNEEIHIYLATGLSPEELEKDDDEFIDIVSVPIKRAFEMAQNGEIQDGKTLAGLLLAQSRLQ